MMSAISLFSKLTKPDHKIVRFAWAILAKETVKSNGNKNVFLANNIHTKCTNTGNRVKVNTYISQNHHPNIAFANVCLYNIADSLNGCHCRIT